MQKKVIVIGAGLGGIAAAVSLAAEGFNVDVYEKNNQIGGKLNVLEKEGFGFDLGPSIFTLPHLFERLFKRAGKKMEDYLTLQPVTPHWRNFFEDGTVVDLYKDEQKMKAELDKLGVGLFEEFTKFRKYSARQYDIVEKGYFDKGLDNTWEFIKFYPWIDLLWKLDSLGTMDKGVRKFFSNPYLIDIFNFFIKYVGSSAIQAPAFFNLMPHIQFEYDLWYVKDGMYNLARGLKRLMDDLQIKIHLGSEVRRIEKSGSNVTGIRLENGETRKADIVVSNMEVIPAYKELLGEEDAFMKGLEKFEPACSGLVLHLGTDKIYENLAHHNFFFSQNQSEHFNTVFKEHKLPHDPTLYVVAPTRTDSSKAPAGCDNIKVLPHIPYIDDENPYTEEDYRNLRNQVLDKLERTALPGLREHIIVEDMWTPVDIQRNYFSNKGSVYGVVSDREKNFGFKAPKQSSRYSNLYFTGGSVNPGGGMPMVVLCGQNVCDRIVRNEAKGLHG
ncbi:MAG: phytoene desaturase [Fibrobacteria bacterium]|nr:phytoene desaturase [Fibrobacteria bacterium]